MVLNGRLDSYAKGLELKCDSRELFIVVVGRLRRESLEGRGKLVAWRTRFM